MPLGGADLRFISPQPHTSLHCKTTDTGLVPAYALLIAYPRRGGQAELTLVVGYITDMVYLSTDGHPSKY